MKFHFRWHWYLLIFSCLFNLASGKNNPVSIPTQRMVLIDSLPSEFGKEKDTLLIMQKGEGYITRKKAFSFNCKLAAAVTQYYHGDSKLIAFGTYLNESYPDKQNYRYVVYIHSESCRFLYLSTCELYTLYDRKTGKEYLYRDDNLKSQKTMQLYFTFLEQTRQKNISK